MMTTPSSLCTRTPWRGCSSSAATPSSSRINCRAPQERTVMDLYDRARHKDLALPEEQVEGRRGGAGGGRAEGSGQRRVVAKMEVYVIFLDPSWETMQKVPGISADYQREEKQIDQLNTSRSCPSDQWVLLKKLPFRSDSLKEFASWTNATVTKEWARNVTHVIVGKSAGSACSRTYEVLIVILFGKWVVTVGWIMDCLEELVSGPETSYEIKFSHDSHTSIDGPKKGRIRAAVGVQGFGLQIFCRYFFLTTTAVLQESSLRAHFLIFTRRLRRA